MAAVDLNSTDQPDALIELAWKSGLDRRDVIRAGSDAAKLLLATERYDVVTRFWPVPRPLEAVDHWADNAGNEIAEGLRPFGSALVPGCVFGALVAHFLVAPFMSDYSGDWAMVFIIVASIIVIGFVFKLLIERTLKRRVAALDEQQAFDIVIDQLRRGKAASPRVIPIAVTRLKRRLAPAAGQ